MIASWSIAEYESFSLGRVDADLRLSEIEALEETS
jgi:hypothetical protein